MTARRSKRGSAKMQEKRGRRATRGRGANRKRGRTAARKQGTIERAATSAKVPSGNGSVVERKLKESQDDLAARAEEAKKADRNHADAKWVVESRAAAQKDLVAASNKYAASAEQGAKEI